MMAGIKSIGAFVGALSAVALGAGPTVAASSKTEAFVAAAGQADTYEIQAARLIVTQSQDPRIKAFAQQMIEHHGQTYAELVKAAAAAGAPEPPRTVSGDQQRMLGALQSMTGPSLDRAYMTQQVNAHESALVTQQDYAASGDRPPLKAAAQATVPIIQSHLDQARRLKASLPAG